MIGGKYEIHRTIEKFRAHGAGVCFGDCRVRACINGVRSEEEGAGASKEARSGIKAAGDALRRGLSKGLHGRLRARRG